MKEKLSLALLKRFRQKTPALLICTECQILLNLMASSCDVPSERILFLPHEKALEAYARFSVKCMKEGKADPHKLYESALRTGKKIAKICGLQSEEDRRELIFLLYRNISITMQGSLPGEIIVPRCYFANHYTPKQCALMSNVDAGIIAGIMGDGTLCFHERLSAGCTQCRASFTKEKNI